MKNTYLILLALLFVLNEKTVAQIFHEDFEIADSVTFTTTGNSWWSQTNQVQTSGQFSFFAPVDSAEFDFLYTLPINASATNGMLLKFNHICRIDYMDAAFLEWSVDGTTYFPVDASMMLPNSASNNVFGGQGSTFSSASQLVWDPANATTSANNSMWKTEYFDLSALSGVVNLTLRFGLMDLDTVGTNGFPGWYIDDIEITTQFFGNLNFSNYNPDTCTLPNTFPFLISGNAIGNSATDSIALQFYFGDGTDTTFSLPIVNNRYSTALYHNYFAPGSYSPYAIAVSAIGQIDSVMKTIQVLTNANCGSVSGYLYEDANNNCVYDVGEIPVRYGQVFLYDNGTFLQVQYADTAGKYNFYNVPLGGNYMVEVDSIHLTTSPGIYTVTCPANGQLGIPSIPSGNNNFGMFCNGGFDFWTMWQCLNVISSNVSVIYVHAYDFGCSQQNATIKLILDSSYQFINSTIPVSSIAGDTLIWNSPLGNNQYFFSVLNVLRDTTLTINDTICLTTLVEPTIGDMNVLNNEWSRCFLAQFPYDPNNKTVTPEGNILPKTTLTYTVNFQNTGTAPAVNVYILDTLDANFDLASLNIIGSSHPINIYILDGNILKADFPSIMLPDSNTNEPASHGFFSYSIKTKPALINGTLLENSAHIFFDYNAPIATNTTSNLINLSLNVLSSDKSSELNIFPNPTSTNVSINSFEKIETIELRLLTGDVILRKEINAKQSQVDIENLPSGVYILFVKTNQQVNVAKIVKM